MWSLKEHTTCFCSYLGTEYAPCPTLRHWEKQTVSCPERIFIVIVMQKEKNEDLFLVLASRVNEKWEFGGLEEVRRRALIHFSPKRSWGPKNTFCLWEQRLALGLYSSLID